MPPSSHAKAQAPTIQSVTERIFATGRITREDEKWLMRTARSESALSTDEMDAIKRVFDRLQMGLLRVID